MKICDVSERWVAVGRGDGKRHLPLYNSGLEMEEREGEGRREEGREGGEEGRKEGKEKREREARKTQNKT